MSAALPVEWYCPTAPRRPINVVTVEPAVVGCLQVQPVEAISRAIDMQSQVGREQVPMFFDTAPAAVDPLGEWLFLTFPTQAGLRQSSRMGAVLVEAITAGAFSLAAHHLHEQPRCPVAHTAREVLLPTNVIQLLAHHIRAVREQPVGQRPMQRLTVLSQPAMLLGHTGGAALGGPRMLPATAAWLMSAIRVEAARRAGTVLTIQVSLPAAQPHSVQPDSISQRLYPSRPAPIASLDGDCDLAGPQVERHPRVADRMPPGRVPIADQLHAVGVAAVDHGAHDPGGQHLARRDQRLDLGELGLLLFAASTRRGRWADRDHEPGPPLQPD